MTSIASALKDVAMVVDTSFTAAGMSSLDKRTSEEINHDKHASSDAARVLVSRLPGADHLHKKRVKHYAALRVMTQDRTLQWGKRRLLPNASCQEWINDWYKGLQEDQAMQAELEATIDTILATAERNKGDFNVRIPTKEELLGAYSMSYTLEPIPDPAHVSSVFDPAMNDWLQRQYEATTAAAYQNAQQDLMQRLTEPMQRMIDRLMAVKQRQADIDNGKDPGATGRLYDTVLTNVQDLAKTFHSFNLLGDPVMRQIGEQLQFFHGLDTKALKEDGPTRDDAARRAEEIIKQASGWMGRV